jgi:hypothetical protein
MECWAAFLLTVLPVFACLQRHTPGIVWNWWCAFRKDASLPQPGLPQEMQQVGQGSAVEQLSETPAAEAAL